MRRFLAWLRSEDGQYLMVSAAAAWAFQRFIQLTGAKITRLESRGWTPVDDTATLRDLERLRGELTNTAPADPPPETSGL